MEVSIFSNSVFIWKEVFSDMFKQNWNLQILVSFLSLENNIECACLKPTLNRFLSGFDNYHKIAIRDQVHVPKFWHSDIHGQIQALTLGIYFIKCNV